MYMYSAPVDRALMRVRYPQRRPIVSAIKQRLEAAALSLIRSIAHVALLIAVSVPIASSQPGRLLSIDAGIRSIGIWNAG